MGQKFLLEGFNSNTVPSDAFLTGEVYFAAPN